MKDVKVKNEVAEIYLEEGIMYGIYKVQEITPVVAEQLIEARKNAYEGKDYPLLVDGRAVKSVNKGARDILSSEDAMINVTACALVADSMVGTIIGNFFLRINRPAVPIKLFTNMDEAINWLRTTRKNKNNIANL